MTYRIYSTEGRELVKIPLLGDRRCGAGYEQKLSFSSGNINFRCKTCSHFSIVRLSVGFEGESEVVGELDGDVVSMCFMLGGKSYCYQQDFEPVYLQSRENNLFFNNGLAQRHYVRAEESTDCLKIILKNSYVEILAEMYPAIMQKVEKAILQRNRYIFGAEGATLTPEMYECAKNIDYYSQRGNSYGMYLEAKVRELLSMQLAQFSDREGVVDQKMERNRVKIEKARRLLEKSFQSPPSLHALAVNAGTCDTVLKSGFKFFYGSTVYGYLINYRMEIARGLLKNTELPIAEVAFRVGYEHQSHFATAFKRKFGVTPLSYREQGRNIHGI